MRKWLIPLTALILLMPSPVQAQGAVTLNSLKVRLLPEYDQPSMLVIHDFTLTDDTPVPGSMELQLPKDANITAVAFESNGSLLLANYQAKPGQDVNWQVITLFLTDRTTYHIEYYQPLSRAGDRRTFSYQWMGEYAVKEFDIELQLPGDSTDVKIDPAMPLVQGQSFLSGGAVMKDLGKGNVYQLQVGYSRPSEAVVATPPSPQVEPSAPVDENTDGRSTLNNLPLFLGGFGVALILVALVYFFRRPSSTGSTDRPRKRSHGAQGSGIPSYCPECGTRSQEGDRFCRACGSKLRGN